LNQTIKIAALAQTTTTSTFDMDGEISSLVLGVPENTKIIDMTTVYQSQVFWMLEQEVIRHGIM
jgi:hypothetical protein